MAHVETFVKRWRDLLPADMIEETLSKYYGLKSDTSLYCHNINVTFRNDLLIKTFIVIFRTHKTVR